MQSIEKQQDTTSTETKVEKRLRELMDSGPINNYIERQIQLAAERFGPDHPHDTLDKELLDDTGMMWVDKKYAENWSRFVKNPEFKTHPRFQGNYANVSLNDLEEFITTQKIPK